MQASSQDLRDRVLRALERGDGPSELATRFEVSREWVYDVQYRFEKEGLRHGLPVGGYRVSRVADKASLMRGWIKERKDLTLVELCERLAEHGVPLTPSALWDQLDTWNLRLKKNAARQRASARRRAGRAHAMARKSAGTCWQEARVYRRNRCIHHHDAPAWTRADW